MKQLTGSVRRYKLKESRFLYYNGKGVVSLFNECNCNALESEKLLMIKLN